MKPYITTYLLFCWLILQPINAQKLTADSLFIRMAEQARLFPQEKVYLHTDRNSYVAGETIWIRAHVADGITHAPTQQSRYVYVALQNPFKEVVARIKLRPDQTGTIYGSLPLPEDMPKGEYTLSAYTRYMENFEQAYFFKKRITVHTVMANAIRMQTEQKGNNLDIRFENPITGETRKTKSFTAMGTSGEKVSYRSDSSFTVRLHDKKDKVLLLRTGNYQEFLPVDIDTDYEVDFLPEGGMLIAENFNRIAFKSINTLGQGENITGTIRDEQDSILFDFQSFHRGMGVISFVPQTGKRYVAVCRNTSGKEKRFKLPECTQGYSLQVNEVKGKFFVKVLRSSLHTRDSLYLLAHQKGYPVMVHHCTPDVPTYQLNMDEFQVGTVSFLLVSHNGRILNERMAFVHRENQPEAILSSDSSHYGYREKIRLSLQIPDSSGNRWNGNCSVAVTSNTDITPDSCVNILSSLLLESDLKGYIEAPSWYFRKENTKLRKQALDILMMTQGWRKYDVETAWKGQFLQPSIAYEQSQHIKGKVTRRISRKGVEDARVQMMLPSLGDSREVHTDSLGHFHINGFEYPDSTLYFVSAYTNKSKDNIVIEIDSVIHPVLEDIIPPYRSEQPSIHLPKEISSEYLAKADIRLLQDKGIRHLFLDEVIVTAPRIVPKTEFEKAMGAITLREEDIRQSGVQDILSLLTQKVAGCTFAGDGQDIVIRGEIPAIFVDGVRIEDTSFIDIAPNGERIKMGLTPSEIIKQLNTYDIEQIDVIKGIFAVSFDAHSGGAIIAITTKRGGKEHNAQWGPTNLKSIMPLGYQLPTEFYTPRYELHTEKEDKKLDLRTTIHWQPHLEVKNGKAELEFYTADSPVDYTVIIEGVGEDGSLLRVEERIKDQPNPEK